jgi:hypothetical protein
MNAPEIRPSVAGVLTRLRASSWDEHNFEAVFQVPPKHRLVVVRSRSRGGRVSAVTWEHEEYDGNGQLVARYVSFAERDAAGLRRGGWRKYGSGGQLLAEGGIFL